MKLRGPRPESLLAWAAAVVGLLGVVSALTPEMADRFRLVRGVLPPGGIAAARVAALAFGIALIWLSRSLARRRRRAWQLAVGIVLASALAHLAKGLDVEEAIISLALLVALIRYRSRFDIPGDPATMRPLLALVVALGAVAAVVLGIELHGGELPDRLSDFFTALSILLGFSALFLWLRPFSQVVAQTVGERRVARALVDAYGSDSLSFFALRHDKSYFFSPTRGAFLAYRVVAGRGADQRRPGRRRGGVRRAARRVPAGRACPRLAGSGARRLARAPRPVPAARHACDRDRRGGGAAAG